MDVGFESILTGNKGIFPKNIFSGFCDANSEENIHNERKQSRVVERSDTDDRLQSALNARLRNSSPENTEKIATKQVMMARHISIYV